MSSMIDAVDDGAMDIAEDRISALEAKGQNATIPSFPAISAVDSMGGKIEYRRIRCPPNRLTPLRNQWDHIMTPIVEYLKLQIRFNPQSRSVELKTSELTEDQGAIQKAQDFVEAFMMGFEVQDAVALLRLDDLYIDSFMVTDVKMLHGDHLSRAIGRVAGHVSLLYSIHIEVVLHTNMTLCICACVSAGRKDKVCDRERHTYSHRDRRPEDSPPRNLH